MDTELLTTVVGWILFLVILLGTVGNILSFIVWTKGERCKIYSASVYLSFLSITDTMVLLSTSYFAIRFVTKSNFRLNFTGIACRLIPGVHGLLIHFSMIMSLYTVMCVALERLVAVRWPLKAALLTSRRKLLSILLIIAIFSFALNIPWLFAYKEKPFETTPVYNLSKSTPEVESVTQESVALFNNVSAITKGHNDTNIEKNNNQTSSTNIRRHSVVDNDTETTIGVTISTDLSNECHYDPGSFLETEWHVWFVDFVVLFSIPITVTTICNLILVTTIIRERKRLYSFDSSCSSDLKTVSSGSMTARILAVCIVHCITVGLGSIANIIPDFQDNIGQVDWITLADNAFTCLWFMNNGCNFILYSVFGTAFRRDFKSLFCKR